MSLNKVKEVFINLFNTVCWVFGPTEYEILKQYELSGQPANLPAYAYTDYNRDLWISFKGASLM